MSRPVLPLELDDAEPPPMVELDEEGEAHISWEAHVSFDDSRAWGHATRAWGEPVSNFPGVERLVKAEKVHARVPKAPKPKPPRVFFIPWELRRKFSQPSRKPKRAIFRSPESLAEARAEAEFMRHLGLFQQAETHLAIYGLK